MTGETQAAGVLDTLRAAVEAVERALQGQEHWGPTGEVEGQYHHDTVADAAALAVLEKAGLGVFSEESGLHHPEREVRVVVDPVDGSTNASRGLPWWAISLCAVDGQGPLAAVVASPPTGDHFEAVRGQGATRNGQDIAPSNAEDVARAIIAFNGFPTAYYGWAQCRALGAAALDLCAVACGILDGFVDTSWSDLAPWDYLGGLLVCQEAGAYVQELYGRDLVVTTPGERRCLIAAGTGQLLGQLLERRAAQPSPRWAPPGGSASTSEEQ